MKATLLTSAIALLALSATAQPQQTTPQQTATAEQQAANVPQQTLSEPAAAPATADSPLVAAAKRAGRLNKKPKDVITNESLLKSGGHVTTTKEQAALETKPAAGQAALPTAARPPQTAATKAATKKPEEKAKKDSEAAKKKVLERAVADYMGESIEEVNDDPSVQEGIASKGVTVGQPEQPKRAEPPAAAQKPPSL